MSVALFLTLGLVGAFAVSMVARLAGSGPEDAVPVANSVGVETPVTVEVLNGAGKSGLARTATQHLRSAGFDVVYFGNASTFGSGRSVVLDRVGDPARARAVALSLGIDSVAAAPDSTLLLDVTVVLGDDWPPPPEEAPELVERLREIIGD